MSQPGLKLKSECWSLGSVEETLELGCSLGRKAKENEVYCFTGDLGAGKTTLIKGMVSGYAGVLPEEVTSPTFTYLHIYENNGKKVAHFDLYRLKDEKEFLSCGFEEYLDAGWLILIEWSERISNLFKGSITIDIVKTMKGRKVTVQWI